MAVTARTLRLQRRLRAELDRILDAQTRDLVRAWATAWDELAPDLTAVLLEMLILADDQITRTQLLRSTRLRQALAVIADALERLATEAGVRITADLQAVIDAAGGAQASVIDSQLPSGSQLLRDLESWSRVDERQIAAIVQRTTEQITSLTNPLSGEAYDVVRRELIRGVAAGSNPRATAARMVRRAEKGFNGGLNRALVISRTEMLDAHRAAAALGQSQHADVLAGWRWLAQCDARTCPSCWAQNGTLHDLDEFGPDDHQQGRCARVPVTKPWSELGLDVEEPASLFPDAGALFDALPATEQLAILGPARYEAWASGRFPMSEWSVRRTTPGWRDSWGVAPAPQSAGRRSFNAA